MTEISNEIVPLNYEEIKRVIYKHLIAQFPSNEQGVRDEIAILADGEVTYATLVRKMKEILLLENNAANAFISKMIYEIRFTLNRLIDADARAKD